MVEYHNGISSKLKAILTACPQSEPPYREGLINEFYHAGGAQDFSARITAWRNLLDSIQAPPPVLTGVDSPGKALSLPFPVNEGKRIVLNAAPISLIG